MHFSLNNSFVIAFTAAADVVMNTRARNGQWSDELEVKRRQGLSSKGSKIVSNIAISFYLHLRFMDFNNA
jgi:hypothetical protein